MELRQLKLERKRFYQLRGTDDDIVDFIEL